MGSKNTMFWTFCNPSRVKFLHISLIYFRTCTHLLLNLVPVILGVSVCIPYRVYITLLHYLFTLRPSPRGHPRGYP